MRCNVGKTDRVLRLVAGALIIGAGFYFQNWLGLVGILPFMTGLLRWCPAYVPLGIETK